MTAPSPTPPTKPPADPPLDPASAPPFRPRFAVQRRRLLTAAGVLVAVLIAVFSLGLAYFTADKNLSIGAVRLTVPQAYLGPVERNPRVLIKRLLAAKPKIYRFSADAAAFQLDRQLLLETETDASLDATTWSTSLVWTLSAASAQAPKTAAADTVTLPLKNGLYKTIRYRNGIRSASISVGNNAAVAEPVSRHGRGTSQPRFWQTASPTPYIISNYHPARRDALNTEKWQARCLQLAARPPGPRRGRCLRTATYKDLSLRVYFDAALAPHSTQLIAAIQTEITRWHRASMP